MKRIYLWGIASIAGLILLTLGGAAVYLKLYPVDLSYMRAEIAGEIRTTIGREVNISGPITLGVSFIPYLSVFDLSIANEPWGKAKSLLSIGKMNVRVRLIPLLSGGIDIASVDAENVILNLEINGGNQKNWGLTVAGNSEYPMLDNIKFKNIEINYSDVRDLQPKYKMYLDDIKFDIDDNEAVFDISGKFGEDEIRAMVKAEPFYAIDASISRRFNIDATAFGITVSADGAAVFPLHNTATQAKFLMRAPKGLKQSLSVFDIELPDFGAFEAKGNIVGGNDAVKFVDLLISAGNSDLDGAVFVHTDAQPLRLTAKLHSALLDVSPLLETDEEKPMASRKRLFSDAPFDFKIPAQFNAGVRYAADKIRAENLDISNFKISTRLENGELKSNQFNFELAGGKITSEINHTTKGDIHFFETKLLADSLDLTQLSKIFDWPETIEGRADLLFEGRSSGRSAASTAAVLQGRSYAQITDGKITNKLSSMMSGDVIDVFRRVASIAFGSKDEPIDCALAAFNIKNGRALASSILLLTQQAAVTGSGTIDFPAEAWRLNLKPRPRDLSLVNLATEIRLRGSLLDPEFEVNKSAAAKKAGLSVLGLALGPLGAAIAPVASAIRSKQQEGKGDQCAVAQQAAITGLDNWPELRNLLAVRAK